MFIPIIVTEGGSLGTSGLSRPAFTEENRETLSQPSSFPGSRRTPSVTPSVCFPGFPFRFRPSY